MQQRFPNMFFMCHLAAGVSSMSDDVASNRTGTKTDTKTRTDASTPETRASTRKNLGHRIGM